MFTLVIGESCSGKSKYAERLVSSLDGKHYYIATMCPWDEECLERIKKHRAQRADLGFETLERYTDLAGLQVPDQANLLLEDLGNLTANELYSPDGGGEAAILKGVDSVLAHCRHLTVVTNEVFSGGADYGGDTLTYLQVLASINRSLARRADTVVEMVSLCPNFLKGKQQW